MPEALGLSQEHLVLGTGWGWGTEGWEYNSVVQYVLKHAYGPGFHPQNFLPLDSESSKPWWEFGKTGTSINCQQKVKRSAALTNHVEVPPKALGGDVLGQQDGSQVKAIENIK